MLESLLRLGGGLALSSLALPLPFDGGGLLESRLRLGAGDGDREGDEEYLRRRGGGERDGEPEGLRSRRVDLDFGGGERDTEYEGLRPRRRGGAEREREREWEREDE